MGSYTDLFTGSITAGQSGLDSRIDGSCTYSDTACSWVVDGSGKAVISFTADSETKGNIWQLAGSTDKFAFVMTHADENDIEPGFMTRN